MYILCTLPVFEEISVINLDVSLQEAKDVKVIDCEIFNSFQGTGIAILTSTLRIFIINSVDDPRIRRLAEVPGQYTYQ